ncbi:baculoviral IAP repeat-containing protein 2-like [Mercenaria mercenaria]|uniref:baculoviral IAP repeat-containing protein 2-like n=1 Tax=Mercenaria mercenaria TaxID=6596 RepID=UPI00234F3B41|nr:baculoviral IAP repeat-containing protein 2-like [Mercenaria mercenaria]
MSDVTEISSLKRYLHDTNCEFECLKYEWKRLSTFKDFPEEIPIWTIPLAKNGIYCKGRSNEVSCFFCNFKYSSWENGNNAASLHENMPCPLLTGASCNNIPIAREINSTQESTEMQNGPPEIISAMERDEGANRAASLLDGPKHPAFANYESRVTSFEMFTGGDGSYNKLLAAAGFFNCGFKHSARCHYCGFDLRYRPELDPFEQHAALYGNCRYLEEQRGLAFIKENQERHSKGQMINRSERYHDNTGMPCFCQDDEEQTPMIDNTNDKSETNQQSSVLYTNNPYNTGARPKISAPTGSLSIQESRNGRENAQKIICKICFEREVQIVFLPCRHLVCCGVCAQERKVCLECQQKIKEQKRAFLS